MRAFILHTIHWQAKPETASLKTKLAILHIRVYLYEIALHVPPPSVPTSGSLSSLEDGLLATKYTNLLMQCLEKTKALMDFYIRMPIECFEKHTLLEKGYLGQAIIVLLKLAFITTGGVPENPFPLRNDCNISHYLDCLADPSRNPHASTWQFRDKMLRLKSWYDRVEYFNHDDGIQDMKNLSPSRLEEIAKGELPLFDMDWSTMDLMNFDIANL